MTESSTSTQLTEMDHHFIQKMFTLKKDLPTKPSQTGFKVFAIFLLKPNSSNDTITDCAQIDEKYQEYWWVQGTNTEVCNPGK